MQDRCGALVDIGMGEWRSEGGQLGGVEGGRKKLGNEEVIGE